MRSYPSSSRLLGGAVRLVANEPCLMVEDGERILVASDLHIGFEKELARRGVRLPSQTPSLLAKMLRIVRQHRITRVILLGDVKHGTSKILMHEWTDIPEFFEGLLRTVSRIDIVPGNHDGGLRPLLPSSVKIHPPQGIIIESKRRKLAMIHGHAWPMPQAFSSDCLIMGHHHFTVELRDPSGLRMVEPVWFVANWNARTTLSSYLETHRAAKKRNAKPKGAVSRLGMLTLIVLPAFNPLLGGFPVNASLPGDYLGPVLTSGGLDMDRAELFFLDGTFVGRVENLRQLGSEGVGGR